MEVQIATAFWHLRIRKLCAKGFSCTHLQIKKELADCQKDSRIEEAGKVAVESLVPRDELVGEGETRHDAPLPKPEYGAKAASKGDC